MPANRCLLHAGSLAAALAAAAAARGAGAYSIESSVASSCHEAMAADSLRAVRKEIGPRPVLAPDREQRALVGDLEFRVPDDLRDDLEAVTLLIGSRQNDTKGRSSLNVSEAAAVHGAPDAQRDHCLRRPEHDDEEGNAAAVADCRAYVRDNAAYAILNGTDGRGSLAAGRSTVVDLYLQIAGPVRAPLPLMPVYVGQALHTLQDSFSHTYRATDEGGDGAPPPITVVLNWAEYSENRLVESRDGPPHQLALDRCDEPSDLARRRRAWAVAAGADLLRIVYDTATDPDGKLAKIDELLDRNLQFRAGCTSDNRWCDAPEEALRDPPGGCASAGASLPAALALALLLALRRRRAVGAALAGVALLAVAPVSAQEGAAPAPVPPVVVPGPPAAPPPAAPAPAPACVAGRQVRCACSGDEWGVQRCQADGRWSECTSCTAAPRPRAASFEPSAPGRPSPLVRSAGPHASDPFLLAPPELLGAEREWALYVTGGASIDQTALAMTAGFRYRPDLRWRLGLSAEWNPWWSLSTKKFSAGVLNVYATGIRRFHINDTFAVRTSAHLGTSVLLFDLYGTSPGSTGAYLAVSLLGLEVKLANSLRLVIDPCEVSVPVPHITGAPLVHRQYRLVFGLEIG